jgi:uncharacterized protein YjbI with pentapeptide repeats
MANLQHVEMLTRDGARIWNLWRKVEADIRPDLRGADLRGANLYGVHLGNADLTMALLDEANLEMADLEAADLYRAQLNRALLARATLRGANLARTQLVGANLSEADLRTANLCKANLSEANLHEADLTGADLTGADLIRTVCFGTLFTGATLHGCNVYGISAWDVDVSDARQADLRMTPREVDLHLLPGTANLISIQTQTETRITVDNLEVAQFLSLWLSNPKVRGVLDMISSKVVLILGRFNDERKSVLDAIREALRSHPNGYIPVLFDFHPQQYRPVFATLKALASLARFVIADLTDPYTVRSELGFIVPDLPTVPVQPIIEGDATLPVEYHSWVRYHSFLPVYRYGDLPQLLASLTEAVITPVEGQVRARRLTDADGTQ